MLIGQQIGNSMSLDFYSRFLPISADLSSMARTKSTVVRCHGHDRIDTYFIAIHSGILAFIRAAFVIYHFICTAMRQNRTVATLAAPP